MSHFMIVTTGASPDVGAGHLQQILQQRSRKKLWDPSRSLCESEQNESSTNELMELLKYDYRYRQPSLYAYRNFLPGWEWEFRTPLSKQIHRIVRDRL